MCVCVWEQLSSPLIVTCAHEHTRTQINTQSNTHSITDCYWQMSHSGPIETRGDGVIVVTLVYWYLPIHLGARVSVFREMNREMEVWPLADCLNPSTPTVQSLFHTTSLFFNCLPSPLSYILFISPPLPHFLPPSPPLPPLIFSPFAFDRLFVPGFAVQGKCSPLRTQLWDTMQKLPASLWDSEQITWRNPSQLERS